MNHNILALTVYGTYWHPASQRLFHVTRTSNGYEARHVASWYVGTGATIEAAMTDAAAHWTDVAPTWDQIMDSIEHERIAA